MKNLSQNCFYGGKKYENKTGTSIIQASIEFISCSKRFDGQIM